MARMATCLASEVPPFFYNVTFIVRETGIKLTRSFEAEHQARNFVTKLKHSRRCILVSHPLFR